jgi:hypothetical protein
MNAARMRSISATRSRARVAPAQPGALAVLREVLALPREVGLHLLDEARLVERRLDVPVTAGGEREIVIGRAVPDRHERDAGERAVLLEARRDVGGDDVGKLGIGQHQIGGHGERPLDPVEPRRALLDGKLLRLQEPADQRPGGGVALDAKDTVRHRFFPPEV